MHAGKQHSVKRPFYLPPEMRCFFLTTPSQKSRHIEGFLGQILCSARSQTCLEMIESFKTAHWHSDWHETGAMPYLSVQWCARRLALIVVAGLLTSAADHVANGRPYFPFISAAKSFVVACIDVLSFYVSVFQLKTIVRRILTIQKILLACMGSRLTCFHSPRCMG